MTRLGDWQVIFLLTRSFRKRDDKCSVLLPLYSWVSNSPKLHVCTAKLKEFIYKKIIQVGFLAGYQD